MSKRLMSISMSMAHVNINVYVTESILDTSSGVDNRSLVSANEDNQNLNKDSIHALKKDGLTGDVR